jgi:hypothetical protein
MTRHLITIAFLLVALLFYAAGFSAGAIGLMVVGACFEIVFWIRALGGTETKSDLPAS